MTDHGEGATGSASAWHPVCTTCFSAPGSPMSRRPVELPPARISFWVETVFVPVWSACRLHRCLQPAATWPDPWRAATCVAVAQHHTRRRSAATGCSRRKTTSANAGSARDPVIRSWGVVLAAHGRRRCGRAAAHNAPALRPGNFQPVSEASPRGHLAQPAPLIVRRGRFSTSRAVDQGRNRSCNR